MAFAIYQNVQDEGIESMYLSLGAAVIPIVLYPFLKIFVKRGQPDAVIELDGADVNLLIGTRG